jgi:carbonic anhydrase
MENYNIVDNSRTQTKISQAQINPKIALGLLKNGNERFLNNLSLKRSFSAQIIETSSGQYPFAVILSCIDSRIPTEIVFDQGIGDIFNARIAGNFVNEDILGSMEFACKLAGSKLIVVMGHTSCGAVKGACDAAKLGNLTQMLEKIQPAVTATTTKSGEDRSSGNLDFVNRVALENVKMTITDITDKSEVLHEMKMEGSIDIVGAMYNVASGKVDFI